MQLMTGTRATLLLLIVCLIGIASALRVSSSLQSKHRTTNALDSCFKTGNKCQDWDSKHDLVNKPLDMITLGSDRMCRIVQLAVKLPNSFKRCNSVAEGPYKDKCCCHAELTAPHFFCESLHSSPSSFDPLKSPVDWVKPWPVLTKVTKSENLVSQTLVSLTHKIPTSGLAPLSDVQNLFKPTTDLLTTMKAKYIDLDPKMTDFPPSDEADVIAYRLNQIEKDHKKIHNTAYPEILHQIGLYRDLMGKNIRSRDFLKATIVCVANLHAAVKILKFIQDGNELIPEISGVGDHFFANALIGQNYYNAYKFHSFQIKGLQDPMIAVSYVTNVGPSLKDEATQKLLTQTLALDMSSWARLQAKSMRVNGDLEDQYATIVYPIIQDFIERNWKVYKDEGFDKNFASGDYRYTKLQH